MRNVSNSQAPAYPERRQVGCSQEFPLSIKNHGSGDDKETRKQESLVRTQRSDGAYKILQGVIRGQER